MKKRSLRWLRRKLELECTRELLRQDPARREAMAAWLATLPPDKRQQGERLMGVAQLEYQARVQAAREAARLRDTRLQAPGREMPLVLHEEGPPCRRCKRLMQVRTHGQITNKLLQQPYYYSRWYFCMTPTCRTRQVMPSEFIVRAVPDHEDTWGRWGARPIARRPRPRRGSFGRFRAQSLNAQ